MDEFQGFDPRRIAVPTRRGEVLEIEVMPWRRGRYVPGQGVLRLHHLHGAGTWIRMGGEVFKARSLENIREAGLFSAWAERFDHQLEGNQPEPVVILGDHKEASVRRPPFDEAYESFAAAVSSADEIVLAGFSFKDRPVNRTIATFRRSTAAIIVINPADGIRDTAIEALQLPGPESLHVIPQPLPDGLETIG